MSRTDPRLIWLAVGLFVLTVLAANTHLAYVAFTSQPDCVADAGTGYSAATRSC